ncbi:MAG: uroporphyrinogen decarboxylase family protein [Planctomycetota bacterium]|jgi:uroporphyrinogen decarboxylase
MEGSIQRVRKVLQGEMPDRAPLFDLLRNDAVIGHFTGQTLTVDNAAEVVPAAYAPTIDATRSARLPDREDSVTLDDGRAQRIYRWTTWTEPVRYESSDAYRAAKTKWLDSVDPSWTDEQQADIDFHISEHRRMQKLLGECFWMSGGGSPAFMMIMGEVGLEAFSYYTVDCPDIIVQQMEYYTQSTVEWVSHLPDDHGIEAVMIGDDIAFKSGPFLAPKWFDEHYMPRLARVIDAHHAKGMKVMFHTDGDAMPILSGLVDAGIDGLNPIEVTAGMDIAEIHRRHPHIFMCGGIDVSNLLPFGTPQQVRDATKKAIDDAEGRIMIGSSTELNDQVPLENFLAMRQAVLDYAY